MYAKIENEVSYNPEDGSFQWVRPGRGRRKTRVGNLNTDGYVRLRINGINYPAHKAAWYLFYKEWPEREIDHIDRDRSNNRINNLRLATRSQNSQNTTIKKLSTSKYRGVSWDSSRNKWIVSICVEGRTKHLGRYSSEEEASLKFIEAAKVLHGEFFAGRFTEM